MSTAAAIPGPNCAPRTTSERHTAWLELHDTGRWSYGRIARFAGVTTKAVRLAIRKLRNLRDTEGPTNREACGDELARYLDSHPDYRDNRVVKDWMQQNRRRLD